MEFATNGRTRLKRLTMTMTIQVNVEHTNENATGIPGWSRNRGLKPAGSEVRGEIWETRGRSLSGCLEQSCFFGRDDGTT